MAVSLRKPRAVVERALKQRLNNDENGRVALVALREMVRDGLRSEIKDLVKEAVREVQEETSKGSRQQRRRALVYAGLGTAVGYYLAKKRTSLMAHGTGMGEEGTAVEIADETE